MPDLHLLGGDPERDDAEQVRLSLAWNAFLRGETDALDALDPQDAAVIDHLDLLARTSKPRNAFANQLKEQLMDASVSLPSGNAYRKDPPSPLTNPRSPASIRSTRRWWNSSRHALGAVATIALVAVSLFGGYLAISSSDRGGGDQHGLPGFAAMGTPAASPVSCENCNDYLPPSTAPVEVMGDGFINMGDLSEDQRAATNVQLQDWVLDPSATAQVPPETTNGMTGAVVDVVIDGAAVVTIDAPATLSKQVRPAHTPDQKNVYYLKAGETAALGPGDVISYPAGHARTIKNPLPMTPLHVKSAVFYAGNTEPTPPTIPESGGLHVEVDGSAALEKALKEYGKYEVIVELDYIQIHDGAALPEHRYNDRVDRVLGPVDPLQPQSGYVLWVGKSIG